MDANWARTAAGRPALRTAALSESAQSQFIFYFVA
jgi:hypothetical protein